FKTDFLITSVRDFGEAIGYNSENVARSRFDWVLQVSLALNDSEGDLPLAQANDLTGGLTTVQDPEMARKAVFDTIVVDLDGSCRGKHGWLLDGEQHTIQVSKKLCDRG